PEERMEVWMAGIITGQVGKTRDFTAIVDCSGRVPRDASEVADVHHAAVFPEHGVLGAQRSHGLVASAGDAYYLAPVIDRGGSRVRIASERRECLDMTSSRFPEDCLELKHLGGNAGRIVNGSLRPSDDLARCVGAGGISIVAAQRWKRGHHPVLPHEA